MIVLPIDSKRQRVTSILYHVQSKGVKEAIQEAIAIPTE